MTSIRTAIVALGLLIACIARELATKVAEYSVVALDHTARGADWITARCDALRARLEAPKHA